MDALKNNKPRLSEINLLDRTQNLLISGEWVPALSAETFDVFSPSTGSKIASVAEGKADDIDNAVKAAQLAFSTPPWSSMAGLARARLLYHLADLIESNANEIAFLESLDTGNTINSIKMLDIPIALARLRNAASWADKLMGVTPLTPTDLEGMSYTIREPIGVCGLITPWNAPFLMALNKIGSALSAGCTCVLKPAELAPLSAIKLGELIIEAGFPPGVVNIVTGYGSIAGQALVDHSKIRKVSFTGSTQIGKKIHQDASSNLKRLTLELGGKSAVLVFADADIDKLTVAISKEICFKSGQFCMAGTRLFIEKSIYENVISAIVDKLEAIKVGPSLELESEMGAIISEKQLEKVINYIETAKKQGARVLTGGHRIESDGYFIEPTILSDVSSDMAIMQEEIFGPVLCVSSFDRQLGLKAIAELANDSKYGLAAKLWTNNLETAQRMTRLLEAGAITVNGGGGEFGLPGGGYKESGIGREGGYEGVISFTELKSVSMGW